MPNMEGLLNQILVEITRDRTVQQFITKIGLDYAYGQMKLFKETSRKIKGILPIQKGFYGLADIPTIFQDKNDRRKNTAHRHG